MEKITDNIIYNEMLENLKLAIAIKSWQNANNYNGFCQGMLECFTCQPENWIRQLDWAVWNLEGHVKNNDFGSAAFWDKYLEGYKYMQNVLLKEGK